MTKRTIYFILVLLQILYQSRRPSWEDNLEHGGENELLNENIIICEASFSNPSSSLFNFIMSPTSNSLAFFLKS